MTMLYPLKHVQEPEIINIITCMHQMQVLMGLKSMVPMASSLSNS